MKDMNIKDSINFVYKFKDWERGDRYKFGLSNFSKFLNKIGAPHTKLNKPILIGGTKGKGSTANMLATILRKSGKTGLFTSPHLVDIRERIKINDGLIPANDFSRILDKIKPHITQELSTFEILTAVAFVYFAEENTDFSIFEVGLGGRLDATNVISPEISVLTTISFDHTEVLGNTLPDITREKCGIIRAQGQVVSSPQDPEVIGVIKEICKEKHAKLGVIGEDFFCSDLHCNLDGIRFKITDSSGRRDEYFTSLLGRHQAINSLVAIYTAQLLGIPKTFIKEGLEEVRLHGRLEIVRKKPTVIYDIAHNVASIWVLRRAISELFDFRKLFVIFGVLKDKDKGGMIRILAEITDTAYVVPVKSERSADADKLFTLFKQEKIETKKVENAEIAMKMVLEKARPQDLILVTGSSYIIGELLLSSL